MPQRPHLVWRTAPGSPAGMHPAAQPGWSSPAARDGQVAPAKTVARTMDAVRAYQVKMPTRGDRCGQRAFAGRRPPTQPMAA